LILNHLFRVFNQCFFLDADGNATYNGPLLDQVIQKSSLGKPLEQRRQAEDFRPGHDQNGADRHLSFRTNRPRMVQDAGQT
jgi:hypothetical protein